MTFPRQIVPGRIWLVTRKCTEDKFLLRPDQHTNAIFTYCLANAARRTGVRVIGYLVMSNHYHAVVCDPLAELPGFMEHLNKLAARALNLKWDRKDNLWAAEPACTTHLVNPSDVMASALSKTDPLLLS